MRLTILSVSSIIVSTSILAASVFAVPSTPRIKVEKATLANVKAGQLIPVGMPVITAKPRFLGSSVSFGGSAVLSVRDWGVSRIAMTPNSQVSMSAFGYCFGGGRTSQFEVLGETYFTTRPKTHQCTSVIVCLTRSQGCVELASDVAIVPLKNGDNMIAVQEGKIKGLKRLTTKPVVTINGGQFSTVNKDGVFTAPQAMDRSYLVSSKPYTKTLTIHEVPEGFQLNSGGMVAQTLILPNGLTPALVTPFTKK